MLRDIYFARYPGIQKWHNFVRSQLGQRTRLTAASGQDRQFFGRPDEILTKAVAHEPQANTTYVTNLAMHNLWNDISNRLPNGTLRIQLLHQVHDALLGQFKIEDTAWAVSKIRSWFNNPIKVAHQTLIIPFEGGYGRSWGELKNAI
jgi:DNA polymerase I-like protein with 3'-5' exonuclease and polymerase domains